MNQKKSLENKSILALKLIIRLKLFYSHISPKFPLFSYIRSVYLVLFIFIFINAYILILIFHLPMFVLVIILYRCSVFSCLHDWDAALRYRFELYVGTITQNYMYILSICFKTTVKPWLKTTLVQRPPCNKDHFQCSPFSLPQI